MMARDEVMVRTVDHALAEEFKRDKLWRKEREAFLAQWDADEQRRKHRDIVEPTS